MSADSDQMSQRIQQTIQQLMQQYGVNYAGQMPNFSKVPAPDMSKVIGMNLTKDQQDQLDLQLKLANQLQQGEQRGTTFNGTTVPQGATLIPANPLAVGVQMYTHLKGIMDSASLKDQQTSLFKKQSDALDAWQNILQGTDQQLANYNFSPQDNASPASTSDDEDTSQWQ
jgi:hypothetical protein